MILFLVGRRQHNDWPEHKRNVSFYFEEECKSATFFPLLNVNYNMSNYLFHNHIYLFNIYIFKSILIFIFCYTHIKAGPSLVMPVPICLFTICCRLNAVSHRLASSDELSADKPISVWLPPGWGNRNMCQVLPPIMFWGKVQFHVFAFCYFWADPVLWARRRAKIVSWWRDRARVRDEIRHTSGWFQLRPAIVIRISHVFKCLPHCH